MRDRSLKRFFRSHLLGLVLVIAGGVVTSITLCCDIVSLYSQSSLVQYRVLFQWQKPEGMSILPPTEYHFSPPGGSLEPLSTADIFSLCFPLVYLVFLIVEVFRYYRWKRKD